MVLLSFNFWHFKYLCKFKQFSVKNSNMTRLTIWKINRFLVIKVYIFEKYFIRPFEWYVTSSQK